MIVEQSNVDSKTNQKSEDRLYLKAKKRKVYYKRSMITKLGVTRKKTARNITGYGFFQPVTTIRGQRNYKLFRHRTTMSTIPG